MRILLLAACSLVLECQSQQFRSSWSSIHGPDGRTRRTDNPGPTVTTLNWALTGNGSDVTGPVIGVDDTVIQGFRSTPLVMAYNGASGGVKWGYVTDGPVSSAPSVGTDGTVYIASDAGTLHAVNGLTGAKRWSTPLGSQLQLSSPAIGNGNVVYVGLLNGNLTAINGQNGAILWSQHLGGAIASSCIVSSGKPHVYCAFQPTSLAAVDSTNGKILWSQAVGPVGRGGIAVSDDETVLLTSTDHHLYRVNGTSGSVMWAYDARASINSIPAITADNYVTFSVDTNRGHAVYLTTGLVRWQSVGVNAGLSAAVSTSGLVFTAKSSSVVALKSAAGSTSWTVTTTAGNIVNQPAVGTNGLLYLTSTNYQLLTVGAVIPTATATPSPTSSVTPSATVGSSVSPTASSTSTASASPTPTASLTPSPSAVLTRQVLSQTASGYSINVAAGVIRSSHSWIIAASDNSTRLVVVPKSMNLAAPRAEVSVFDGPSINNDKLMFCLSQSCYPSSQVQSTGSVVTVAFEPDVCDSSCSFAMDINQVTPGLPDGAVAVIAAVGGLLGLALLIGVGYWCHKTTRAHGSGSQTRLDETSALTARGAYSSVA